MPFREYSLLLILALAAVVGGCGKGDAQATGTRSNSAQRSGTGVEVTMAPVVIRPIERTIEITGTLFGEEETTISAKLSGRVVEVFKDVGDEVLPGDRLAQIETRDYELTLAERTAALEASLARIGLSELPETTFDASLVPTVIRARAEAANAEARYQRATKLFEQTPPLISEQDFADIRTQWEVAGSESEVQLLTARAILAEARTRAAEVAVAAQRLADAAVTVPQDPGERGLRYGVSQRLVSLGEFVGESREMFRLVASDLIKFRADVPERFVGRVKLEQSVYVWVESSTDSVQGTIARISPRIDPASRTFQIEIHVPNKSSVLKPGAFARGQIVTGSEEGVTLVPREAVVTFAGVNKVFSTNDGKAVEHRVSLGTIDRGMIEIVGGLEADQVVTRGASGLSAGAALNIKSGAAAATPAP